MSIDISWVYLLLGTSLLFIPIALSFYFKLEIIKNLTFAFLRMVIQLLLVGIFLKYLFEWDNIFLNITWLILIIFVGSYTISSRSEIDSKVLFYPVLIGFSVAFLISTLFLSQLFFFENDYFDAKYVIPISGMLIGNSLSSSIVGIRSFFSDIKRKKEFIEYLLIGGCSLHQATQESVKFAIAESFKPMLGNIATIGLIWLPGTMTGQIIAGSSPIQAVKFQFLIVVGYFSTCFIATILTLLLSGKKAFDDFGRLKDY